MTDDPGADALRPPTPEERQASAPFRVRFDESTPAGLIRTSVLLRYAADLAWIHSELRGMGRDWYRRRGLAGVVRAAQLEILVPVADGDVVMGTTTPTAARKVMARRRTIFRAGDGTEVAGLTMDWALTGAGGIPTRIPAEVGVAFGLDETGFSPIRVRAAPTSQPVTTLTIRVRPQELDPMGHVNNAVYLDWAEEAIRAIATVDALAALTAVPRRWSIEYLGSAPPSADVHAIAWPAEDGWSCRIANADSGEPYASARLEA